MTIAALIERARADLSSHRAAIAPPAVAARGGTQFPSEKHGALPPASIREEARPAPPAIDPRRRRDVIAEQPDQAAYIAWLLATD